jgi:glutathione S-transferase
MVMLHDEDVRTREVLDWKGLHVFHASYSSCSQKLRAVLNVKGIDWKSHPIDLSKNENITPYYLGINPRGLVPSIVLDGVVHIESNDIIALIEDLYPNPRLIPDEQRDAIDTLLEHEDALHVDLRNLSMRFVFALPGPPKSAEDLKNYATLGSGTVGGQSDAQLDREIAYWNSFAANGGITDEAAKASVQRFKDAFDDLESRLAGSEYLLGDEISVLDIAWIIYVERLRLAGYPIARLYPRLELWSVRLMQREEIAKEVAFPPSLAEIVAQRRKEREERGEQFEKICGIV